MFGTIMGSLALLAAVFCCLKMRKETKRRGEQNTALLRYVDESCKHSIDEAVKQAKNCDSQIENSIAKRLENLEKGVIPDYEKAVAATQSIDNFNAGISGILGFDPLEALKASREKENGGVHE